MLGYPVGFKVGKVVGSMDGDIDGTKEGNCVGPKVGRDESVSEGTEVEVGSKVDSIVGDTLIGSDVGFAIGA